MKKRRLVSKFFSPFVGWGMYIITLLAFLIFVLAPKVFSKACASSLILLIILDIFYVAVRCKTFSIINLHPSHEIPTFWQRKKDDIILIIITAFLTAIVSNIDRIVKFFG